MENSHMKQDYRVLRSYPLSPTQQWFPRTHSPVLNLSLRLEYQSEIDLNYFQSAWQRVISNEPLLRTVFLEGEQSNENVEIETPFPFPIDFQDFSHLDERAYQDQMLLMEKELNESVDLSHWPLLKIGLYKKQPAQYTMFVVHPAWIGDLISVQILLKKFSEAYDSITKGEKEVIQASDQDNYDEYRLFLESLPSQTIEDYKENWIRDLRDLQFSVPVDYFKGENTYESERCYTVYWDLPKEKLKGAKGSRKITSIYSYLLLALARTLSHWTKEDDVVFCERVHGRNLQMEKNTFEHLGVYTVDHPIKMRMSENNLEKQIEYINKIAFESSIRGALYNYLNESLGESLFPQHQVSPIRIDFGGKHDSKPMDQMIFESYRGRCLISQEEFDINYHFINSSKEIRDEVLKRDRLFLLDFNGYIYEGKLVLGIFYSNHYHCLRTIQYLGKQFIKELEWIVDELAEKGYRCFS